MADPFLAQIVMFGGNFAPRGWAFCDGQLLPISQNTALFSLLGTTYGGDGRTTFGLPDLRGRLPMHPGSGPGLTTRSLGQKSGTEDHTLAVSNLPAHSHTATAQCVDGAGNTNVAKGNYCSKDLGSQSATYHDGTGSPTIAAMHTGTVSVANTGGGQSVNHVPPFQCVNFIIALVGVFPSRS